MSVLLVLGFGFDSYVSYCGALRTASTSREYREKFGQLRAVHSGIDRVFPVLEYYEFPYSFVSQEDLRGDPARAFPLSVSPTPFLFLRFAVWCLASWGIFRLLLRKYRVS